MLHTLMNLVKTTLFEKYICGPITETEPSGSLVNSQVFISWLYSFKIRQRKSMWLVNFILIEARFDWGYVRKISKL